jgi:hypothetical protein
MAGGDAPDPSLKAGITFVANSSRFRRISR